MAASDHTVLEANTNTAISIVSAEGIESFSYSKSQIFLGMPFFKNMHICKTEGMREVLCLTVNHLAECTYAFFILKLLTFLSATSNHPLKTLPTFKTIELTDSSDTAVLDGKSKLY